jgi:hypothetical protein
MFCGMETEKEDAKTFVLGHEVEIWSIGSVLEEADSSQLSDIEKVQKS